MAAKKTKKRATTGGLDEINGYKVLPVQFPGLSTTHYLYFRQHSSKKGEDVLLPSSRTLYLYNLPADTTERDLRRLFNGIARIARVVFHDVVGSDAIKDNAVAAKMTAELAKALMGDNNNTTDKKEEGTVDPVPRGQLLKSGASAHIVLLEDEEMKNVLNMKAGTITEWPLHEAEETRDPRDYRGISRYLYEYRAARPPTELLKKEVDAYMAKFEEAKYERERILSQQQNVADEDGFITVVRRGGSNKNTDGTATVTAMSATDARLAGENKKKQAVYGDLYRFQVRERKRDQLTELRKKFEEDKEKIARMRQARHFRPY